MAKNEKSFFSLQLKIRMQRNCIFDGRKVYWSSSIQFRIVSYQALSTCYDYSFWDSVSKFSDKQPDDAQKDFRALLNEGSLVTHPSLQAALYEADEAAPVMVMVVTMRWDSLL